MPVLADKHVIAQVHVKVYSANASRQAAIRDEAKKTPLHTGQHAEVFDSGNRSDGIRTADGIKILSPGAQCPCDRCHGPRKLEPSGVKEVST